MPGSGQPLSEEDLLASADAFVVALGEWFGLHQRELPWRRERSPYRVWLSEIMLQQTQVATVVGYFERFVTRFPTVERLADADLDEVLSMWSGLGYYRRGRNLHTAARQVVERGGFPDTIEGLTALAGVGAYTAGAIATFAFGARTPMVDGNVQRVLSRLFNDSRPVNAPPGKAAAWRRAGLLVDAAEAPAVLNEGLMELGALVCTPKLPRCDACPWADGCGARSAGTAGTLPIKIPKAARKPLHVAAVLITRGDRIWLTRTEGDGLFAGLWAPPAETLVDDDDAPGAWRRLLDRRGVAVPRAWGRSVVVERTLTHRDLTFRATRVTTERTPKGEGRWIGPAELNGLGTSTAVRALLAAAGV